MAGHQRYNRPGRKWECGRSGEGHPCPLGPDARGACQGTSECAPTLDGNGYQCTRPPHLGGPCQEGPLPDGGCGRKAPPCAPRLTLRAKRNLLVLGVFSLSVGIVLVFLGRMTPEQALILPGPLSSRHSSIEHSCGSCHANVDVKGNILGWLLTRKHPHVTSENCLSCHAMSEHALQAHGMEPHQLGQLTQERKLALDKKRSPSGEAPDGNSRRLECMSCHQEHRGSAFDIKAMTNAQCQSCHVQKFDRFSKGHPEFTEHYPFDRRTRIFFDHSSHFGKNFEKAGKKDVTCQTCHVPEPSGGMMAIRGFAVSCAQCHSAQIHGVDQIEKGLVFFRVPGVDVKTLQKMGTAIGAWPQDADGGLTSFQRVLISADAPVGAALARAPKLDLSDLSGLSDKELKDAALILWGVKTALYDVLWPAARNQELAKRLSRAVDPTLKTELGPDELSPILGGLPIDVLRSAAALWFPSLKAEVEAYRRGSTPRTRFFKLPPVKDAGGEDVDWMSAGGWYRSNGDYTIRYRPQGHADPLIRSWLDVAAAHGASDAPLQSVFETLSSPKANPGSCMKCHSVDAVGLEGGGGFKVNWLAKNSDNTAKTFNRFRHVSHFSLLGNKMGCLSCHSINKDAEYEKAYSGHDIQVFQSNFMSIKKANCAACHQAERVGDSCLMCHNYHVGQPMAAHAMFQKVNTVFDSGDATPAPSPTPTPTPASSPHP